MATRQDSRPELQRGLSVEPSQTITLTSMSMSTFNSFIYTTSETENCNIPIYY